MELYSLGSKIGVPPENFWGKAKFKILLKIRRMHPYNFGAMGSNLTKLFQVTCREAGMIKWVHFWGAAPLRIWEGKNRRKIGAILRNFTF